MARSRKGSRPRRRSGERPGVERLEGRSLPSGIGFTSALGVGVSGNYAMIRSNAVATDAAGDTFVTGSFRGTAGFNPSSSSSTITTNSTEDTFVAEYTPAGALDWVATFAGQATLNSNGYTTYAVSQGAAIAVDGSGNVFVAGSFTGTMDVTTSSGVVAETSATSATEPFVAKLNASGTVTWFDAVAGTAYDTDTAYGLALDGSGGAVIAGSFSDSATFGSTTLTAGGSSDAFVARVNGAGTFLWAVASQGSSGSNASVQGVAVDGSGNVDLAGSFSGTVDFNPSSGTANLTSAGSDDAMAWKLDKNGNFLWARSYGSPDYDAATAVAVDASGDLYLTGAFSDTVNFGTVANPDNLTAGPVYDAFLLKLDPNGNTLWADGLVGPSGSSKGQGVAVDPSGTVHVDGTFSGPIAFSATDTLTSVASSDAFVAGYDTNGNLVYALQAGQTNFNAALGIAVNPTGTVALSGTYSSSIAFGSTTLPAIGVGSIFVAQVVTQFPPAAPSAPVLEAGSDSGLGQGNFDITNVTSPFLDVNTAVATDTVELLRNGVVVAQRTGPGALQDPGPLAQGVYTYTAVQVSAVGLVSPASSSCTVTVLTTPPAQLPAPTLDPADDSGVVGDGITNVKQPRLEVVVAGSALTVQLLNAAGTVIGSGYQAGAGTCVVRLSQPLADGVYPIRAEAVDPAGNIGAASPAFTLTIDTTPPAAPSVLTLLPADDSGAPGGDITNVRQPRLTGTAEPNSTVQVVDGNGNVDGSAVASSTGAFTVKIASPLADGTYVLAARATDVAGNQGPLGQSMTLIILGTPPTAPATPSIVAADVSGPAGSNLTNVRQPRVTGTAKVGTTVEILTSTGTVLASTAVGSTGSYTVKVSSPLADGSYVLDAIAIDAANNMSPASGTITLTIDTTPPLAPSVLTLLPADDSGVQGDDITNVRQPRLTGTAEPNSTVQVVDGNGNVDGSAVASSTGAFTVKIASPLVDGTYVLAARATDLAGNQGPLGQTMTLTIDTTPPLAPSVLTLLPADDSGTLGDDITNVRQPRLTGTAEPNSTVQVVDSSGNVDGSAVASSTGAFTVKIASPLADGTYVLAARATDVAGNQGPLGQSMTLTILGTPPPAPPAPSILAADDSGGPGLTNVRQPRLTGQTAANATVQLIGPTGSVLATTTSAANGSYTVKLTSPLADGTYAIHAVATDVAGNVSPAGAVFSLTILATPPAAPSAPTLLPADDSGTLGDNITNVRQPRLTGTATPGLTVRLMNSSNVVIGTATASSTGAVTVQPSSPLADGTYVLDFVAVDAATNVSAPGGTLKLTILGTPPPRPAAPSLLAVDDTGVVGDGMTSVRRPILVGTAAPGGRIDWISSNGTVLTSTTASATNGSYQLQPPTALVNGAYPVEVRETDVAGNVSQTSLAFNLTIRADPGDDFGNSESDISVFRTSDGTFFVQNPATGALLQMQFGGAGDIPINGDFFGNGHNDIAIYRPSNSTFYAYDPVTGGLKIQALGVVGDVPVPADYDGDGTTDFAVFNPTTATFTVLESATNTTYTRQFGGVGDVPVPADYFGNGHADLAFYRPSDSTFYVYDQITGAIKIVTVGLPYSTPIQADYEGLGHVDPAVYEPSTSTYVIQLSATNTTYTRQFGTPGDLPVPGDYIGDGRIDLAAYQPSNAVFLALDIATNATKVEAWGTAYVTWPTLVPITTWFTFGTAGTPSAKPAADPSASSGPDFADISLTTEVEDATTPSPSSTSKPKAVDPLNLDGWRP